MDHDSLTMKNECCDYLIKVFINMNKHGSKKRIRSRRKKITIKAILTLPTSPAKHFAFFLKLKKLNTSKEIATIMSHSLKTNTN